MAKKPKAEEIINKVEAHYDSTEPLRSRMDQDYSIYRLDPYDAGEDFHNYTSNEPATFADKIVSFLNASELTARIPVNSQEREQREANDQKERFFIGTLRSADERLKMAIQPDVKSQLAWYITLRGWYAGRALLTKNKEGKTLELASILNLTFSKTLLCIKLHPNPQPNTLYTSPVIHFSLSLASKTIANLSSSFSIVLYIN